MKRSDDRISDETARAIWRRASQLQAEAEQRMEERARRLPGGGVPLEESAEDGFHADDVEAAAIEAGISPEFVHIALAELAASDFRSAPLAPWEERAASVVLGTPQGAIGLTRSVVGTVDAVAAAVLRVFPGPPCLLHPGEVADLPSAAGRVVVFNVPKYDWSATANPPFVEKASMVGVRQLHVTVLPLQDDPSRCEVVIAGDLHPGMRNRWRFGALTTLGTGAAGGLGGMGIGVSAALSGAILALPVAVGVAAAGGLTFAVWGLSYRYYLRELEASLEESLNILEASARADSMYGSPRQGRRPEISAQSGALPLPPSS